MKFYWMARKKLRLSELTDEISAMAHAVIWYFSLEYSERWNIYIKDKFNTPYNVLAD